MPLMIQIIKYLEINFKILNLIIIQLLTLKIDFKMIETIIINDND